MDFKKISSPPDPRPEQTRTYFFNHQNQCFQKKKKLSGNCTYNHIDHAFL